MILEIGAHPSCDERTFCFNFLSLSCDFNTFMQIPNHWTTREVPVFSFLDDTTCSTNGKDMLASFLYGCISSEVLTKFTPCFC